MTSRSVPYHERTSSFKTDVQGLVYNRVGNCAIGKLPQTGRLSVRGEVRKKNSEINADSKLFRRAAEQYTPARYSHAIIAISYPIGRCSAPLTVENASTEPLTKSRSLAQRLGDIGEMRNLAAVDDATFDFAWIICVAKARSRQPPRVSACVR